MSPDADPHHPAHTTPSRRPVTHAPDRVTGWTRVQLRAIEHRDTVLVAPDRDDRGTPGRLIGVWAATVDGDVFVRSANASSRWLASAVTYGRGSATVGGEQVAVAFALVEADDLRDRVDAAFRSRYRDDPYLSEEVLAASRHQIARVRPTAP